MSPLPLERAVPLVNIPVTALPPNTSCRWLLDPRQSCQQEPPSSGSGPAQGRHPLPHSRGTGVDGDWGQGSPRRALPLPTHLPENEPLVWGVGLLLIGVGSPQSLFSKDP